MIPVAIQPSVTRFQMPWNVVAGATIGLLNDWSGVIAVPLAWGVIWCVYSTFRGDYARFIEGWKRTVGDRRIRAATGVYYMREYFVATLSTLGIAVATRAVVVLLS